jgi:O-antigen ligase/tetratricopeptide (TPR) repeat protein
MKILEKILSYGLIIVLFTPLVIGDNLIFPFITTKAYFFYIIIDVLLLCYLFILTKKPLYPHQSKLLLFFGVLIILGFIFDLFGLSFKNSWWGNYERMMGIYTSLHFLIYLWLLLSVFNTKEKYFKLLNISLVVSFLVGFYGLLQNFQVPLFGIVNTGDNRLSATFGNPAYLAGWLLLFLFLAVYLWLKNKHKAWRYFYILSILLNLVILFLTATRGALVGLVLALLTMVLWLIIFFKNKKVKMVSGGLLIIIILLGISIFVFKETPLIKNNLALRRLSEISLHDTTTISRLALWKMSVRAVQDRPIFGYGQNNIRVPLDKYHDYSLTEDWFDSSHNKFFDELLAHGILGFLLQIGFFIYLGWRLIKKRKEDILGSMVLFGLLVAYLVQAMFIFDSFIVGLSFIFILGFLLVNLNQPRQPFISQKIRPNYLVIPLVILLGIIFTFVYFKTIPPAAKIATGYNKGGDVNKSLELYQQADEELFTNYDILAPIVAKTAIDVFSNQEKYTDVQVKRYIDLLAKVYGQAIKDSAGYSNFYINLAKLYQLASRPPRFDYFDKSLELLQSALKFSPQRVDIYYALAQGYFLKGDIAQSENSLQTALNLGVRQTRTYTRLAEVQARRGDVKQALINITKAEELGQVFSFEELEVFARIFIEREEWSAAVEIFKKIDTLQPNNINTYSNIALAYSKIGDNQQAIVWIDKILTIDPSYLPQVNEFKKSLK